MIASASYLKSAPCGEIPQGALLCILKNTEFSVDLPYCFNVKYSYRSISYTDGRALGCLHSCHCAAERRLIMIYTKMTKAALKLCFEAHKEQEDKTGMPYVFHPFHLAEQMTDEVSCICALLHDVIEDTDCTLEDLRSLGFPEEVLEALALLTHDPATPYMDYVKEIAKNPIAKKVKMADLAHNSDITRWDEPTPWMIEKSKKYREALEYLLTH